MTSRLPGASGTPSFAPSSGSVKSMRQPEPSEIAAMTGPKQGRQSMWALIP